MNGEGIQEIALWELVCSICLKEKHNVETTRQWYKLSFKVVCGMMFTSLLLKCNSERLKSFKTLRKGSLDKR